MTPRAAVRKVLFQVVPIAEALSAVRLTEGGALAGKTPEPKPTGRTEKKAAKARRARS